LCRRRGEQRAQSFRLWGGVLGRGLGGWRGKGTGKGQLTDATDGFDAWMRWGEGGEAGGGER
jgi:hypothetical protein